MAGNSEEEDPRGAVVAAGFSKKTEISPKKLTWDAKQSSQDVLIILVFCIFAFMNVLAALYAPIQDCDETFNYWEPTHYLGHGSGLQTWEYSPEYALRSWLYIVIHAIPSKIVSLFSEKGAHQFYAIRVLLGIACSTAQTRLYVAISQAFGARIARIFQIIMLSSSGIFYASVAYLPSSFAMLTTMMGVSDFLNCRSGLRTANGITWFGVGAIVGWPFSGALILPLFLDEFLSIRLSGISDSVFRILNGALQVAVVGVCSTGSYCQQLFKLTAPFSSSTLS